MNLKETYNKIAEDWFKDHSNDDWWVEGTDKFISLLEPLATVLDVGCGAGVKSKYLSEKGLKVVGVDFSEKFIEIAKREVPQVNFEIMDMREIGTITERFDGVFSQASLLHIPKNEVQEVINNLCSVLKSKGYIYIAVKAANTVGKQEEVLRENDYGYEYERFFSYYTMEELEGYLESLNFNVVYQNIKSVGKTSWLQIIGQKV